MQLPTLKFSEDRFSRFWDYGSRSWTASK